MQEVFKDGLLGEVLEYDETKLTELIKNSLVDHVKVFDLDTGNKVGIPEIEESVIEKAIEKKLKEREEKKRLELECKMLMDEFDRKVKGDITNE